jgi:hypothetical protein
MYTRFRDGRTDGRTDRQGYSSIPTTLHRFHGWLIFARVIALFMFVWPYIRPHILCTQLVICLLSHFIHIWYLGWPWSEHAHIIPISRMVDFFESYSPLHVCLTIHPSHILCTQLVICLLSHFIHIWYLGWPWSEHAHIIPISRMVDFCESYSPLHICFPILWNRYMCMLRSWPIKIPNMSKMRQKTND